MGLDSRWQQFMSGGKQDELKLRRERNWYDDNSGGLREYMLVCVSDNLDDDIPF
jgi:hypothetical protein